MIRPALALMLALALARPAMAEIVLNSAKCDRAWEVLSTGVSAFGAVTGRVTPVGVACAFTNVVVDNPGQYVPDWHIGSALIEGPALDWLALGDGAPTALTLHLRDLRFVLQTGDAQMDYLFAAQARASPIQADVALEWDPAARVLTLDRLDLDFPGDNRISLTARVAGVDLSSTAALQMSATGFAVTEADLSLQTHGLFEAYALMALGPMVLPREGDMDAAARTLRADLVAMADALPAPTFSDPSRQALRAVIAELPNPSGVLTLALRSEIGVGPARLMGYAMTGVPQTLDAAAPLFDGVAITIGWEPQDAP